MDEWKKSNELFLPRPPARMHSRVRSISREGSVVIFWDWDLLSFSKDFRDIPGVQLYIEIHTVGICKSFSLLLKVLLDHTMFYSCLQTFFTPKGAILQRCCQQPMFFRLSLSSPFATPAKSPAISFPPPRTPSSSSFVRPKKRSF